MSSWTVILRIVSGSETVTMSMMKGMVVRLNGGSTVAVAGAAVDGASAAGATASGGVVACPGSAMAVPSLGVLGCFLLLFLLAYFFSAGRVCLLVRRGDGVGWAMCLRLQPRARLLVASVWFLAPASFYAGVAIT